MADGLTTKGDDELAAALAGIEVGLADLADPATDAGRMLAADAARRAPRLTGRLRSSITPTRTPTGVTVGTSVSYGAPIHFGVPSRNIPARPFLTDALRASEDQIVKAYATGIDTLIAKEV